MNDLLEAEKWVIGGLLINPENIEQVRGKIFAEDFIDPTLSKTFAIIEELQDQEDVPLDRSTLYSFLKENLGENNLKKVMRLQSDIPSDAALEYWAKVVKKRSLERQLKEAAIGDEIDLGKIEGIVHTLGSLDKEDLLYLPINKIPPLSEEPGARIMTGFTDLDRNLKFGLGNLMVVAGKTGLGKTSLGLGILYHVSKEKAVGVVSIEMTAGEVRERITNSFGDLPKNLLVADPSALSTLELKHICRAMKEEDGVEVILIDYLQLMREREDFRSRHLEISHIIRRVKEISKELKIATIVISQLSRAIDYRGERSLPSLSDLKESGDVEYSADSILFIHQPKKGDEDFKEENVKLLLLAKNRWGQTGKIKLFWNGPKTKFRNYQEEKEGFLPYGDSD